MSETCFGNISILDVLCCGIITNAAVIGGVIVYSNFDYLDLSYYGGSPYTKVNSDFELELAFAALGIRVRIESGNIIFPSTSPYLVNAQPIQAYCDPCVTVINPAWINGGKADLSFYGGFSDETFNSTQELLDILYSYVANMRVTTTELLTLTYNSGTNEICFTNYSGECSDIVLIGACTTVETTSNSTAVC